jgi:energy-converting hydrogenase B subunit Q
VSESNEKRPGRGSPGRPGSGEPAAETAPLGIGFDKAARKVGIHVRSRTGPGILHQLTGAIAAHQGNIISVMIVGVSQSTESVYFEIDAPGDPGAIIASINELPVVIEATLVDSLEKIYGKRIIIMGGGAQVGQVAIGAILEADRHNIRGEHISVDTIPLVGEENLAAAVRAAARLPRVRAIVLAGALMGGDITEAVQEVRAHGLLVVSLNMAGSVPDVADLVVTDPVQAGVMTVMAISSTAKFNVKQLKRRIF